MDEKPRFTHAEIVWDTETDGDIIVHAMNGDPWRFHFGVQGFRSAAISFGWGAYPETHLRAVACRKAFGGTGLMVILIPTLQDLMRQIMAFYPERDLFEIYGMGNRGRLYMTWVDVFPDFQGTAHADGLGFLNQGGAVWRRKVSMLETAA